MSDKTYVFDSGVGTSGLLNSIIPALQNKGVDTTALLAMMGNRGNGFFGDNGGFQDIIALIVIAAIFGNGNFGFGGWGNNGANANGGVEREMLMNAIQGVGCDVNSLASALNCSTGRIESAITAVSTQICNLAGQNGLSFQQVINSIQSGNASLASQLASCCCDIKTIMSQGFSSVAYETQRQTCSIEKAIADSTSQILEGQRAAEMREMQDKLDALRERNSQQATMINNAQQTAAISAMISPLAADIEKIKCKLPETVTLPYSCATAVPTNLVYGNGFGLGLSGFGLYNNWGCGCSNNSLWG